MNMYCLSFIGRTVIYFLADCVLEFPGGNETAHLPGVFMRDQKFFPALSVSDLALPNPEKVVINFMGF